MGEAAAAYKVVLTKYWEDASLADSQKRLEPAGRPLIAGHQVLQRRATGVGGSTAAAWTPTDGAAENCDGGLVGGPDPNRNTDTCTPTCEPPLWRALGGMEEREGVTRPQPDLAASLSQSPA